MSGITCEPAPVDGQRFSPNIYRRVMRVKEAEKRIGPGGTGFLAKASVASRGRVVAER
jgi:hypothetical protein